MSPCQDGSQPLPGDGDQPVSSATSPDVLPETSHASASQELSGEPIVSVEDGTELGGSLIGAEELKPALDLKIRLQTYLSLTKQQFPLAMTLKW